MTAPAPAATEWAHVPLGEFLHLLRRNGFAVGLNHYGRVLTLIESLGPECAPARVRSMMAPLFATTPEQQQRFYRLFDQWFPMFVSAGMDGHPVAGVDGLPDTAVPDPSSRRGVVRRRRRYLPLVTGIAIVGLLALARWKMQGQTPAPAGPDIVSPGPVPEVVAPVGPLPAPAQPSVPTAPATEEAIDWRAVRLAFAVLLVLGFAANEWRHYRGRRIILERQRRERPPLVWPIRVEEITTPLVESAEFLTAARRLRERQTGERERLDIEATIAATIAAQGRPVLQYVKETRPPEYLILIERASARDHQARMFLQLVQHLASEGVHATVYWCEEDPRICEPALEGPTATLFELKHKYPSHRLLMFGSGDGLVDPITGRRKPWVADVLSWPDRALLTPEPSDAWGAREIALARHLVVLPATLGGLQAAIDYFQIPSRAELNGRRRGGSGVPDPDGRDVVRVLKGYLGTRGLQWVCACAVYPDLQWNLTLHLGMLPELGGAIDDGVLNKLVRLPWFRRGAIPDEARAVLLRVIEPAVERAARRTVIALLERHPAPPESIASSRFELDLVVQKFALDTRTRGRRRELARVARQAPRERVLAELAVLRMTEGDPVSPVAMRLPERLRDVFFQGGVSALGLTSGARSLVTMALVAGVLLVGPRQAVSSEEPAPDVAADSSGAPGVVTRDAPTESARLQPAASDTQAALPGPRAVNQPSADSATARQPVPASPPAAGDSASRAAPVSADPEPQPLREPAVGVVRLGSQTPNATLFLGGVASDAIGPLRSVAVTPGEAIAISIRSAGCEPWDSTLTVAAGDTANLGLRNAKCPVVPAAPDRGEMSRLIDQATGITSARLSGEWTGVDSKAQSTTFASTPMRQRLTLAIRDNMPVMVAVSALQPRGGLDAAVTADSVFVTGNIRFTWRGSFGAPEQITANIEVAFSRAASGLQLQRLLIR